MSKEKFNKIDLICRRVEAHLQEIQKLFTGEPKFTLLIRHVPSPDGSRDLVITTDTLPDAITALIQRSKDEGDYHEA